MCGIIGFTWEDKALAKRMLSLLKHRGPDDEGIYSDEYVTLGHRRLSILDLSEKGHQPMPNKEENIWITFNGEIYNYRKLRKILEEKHHEFMSNTDTEVLIHSYEEWGWDFIEKVEGEFAFSIYDSTKKKLYIIRDRVGTKPLYYVINEKGILFSSEIIPIIKNIEHRIDKKSLQLYISQRCVFGRDTIIKEIKRLEPANYIEFDLKKREIKIKEYWQPKKRDPALLREIFLEAVDNRLQSDVPVGAYLSGGLDSSLVVARAQASYGERMKTFSISFEDNEDLSEDKYAEAVAERFGTEHHHFTIGADFIEEIPEIMKKIDEPLADTAIIPTYFLSKTASKHVKVVLTGDGADELFGGYEQYKIFKYRNIGGIGRLAKPFMKKPVLSMMKPLSPFIPKMGEKAMKAIIEGMNHSNIAKGYEIVTSLFSDEEKRRLLKKYFDENPFEKYFKNEKDIVNEIMNVERKTIMAEDYLMKVDKMTMSHSIEPRVPFLDYRMVEISESISSNDKLDLLNEKKILKKAMGDMIPKINVKRKKQRFYVPIDKWMKDQAADSSILESPIIKENMNIEEAGKILTKATKKDSTLYDARQAWTLISLKHWYDGIIQ